MATNLNELIPALRRGDSTAYATLLRELSRPLLAYAHRVTGDWSGAQDAVQEALLSIYRSRGRLGPDSSVRALCFRAVRNHARNVVRNETLRRVREQEAAAMTAGKNAPTGTELWESVQGLPAQQREVIELRYRHGLQLAEVAEVLDIPVGTVSTRQREGLERLRGSAGVAPAFALPEVLAAGAEPPAVPSHIVTTLEGLVMASIANKGISAWLLAAVVLLLLAGGLGVAVLAGDLFEDRRADPPPPAPELAADPEPAAQVPGKDAPERAEPDERVSTTEHPEHRPDDPAETNPHEISFDGLSVTLRGRIVDASGRPHERGAGRVVELLNNPARSTINGGELLPGTALPGRLLKLSSAETDTEGRFTLSAVLAGYNPLLETDSSLHFVARIPTSDDLSGMTSFSLNVMPGSTSVEKDDLEIIAGWPFMLRVLVKDEATELPIAGAVCTLMRDHTVTVHRDAGPEHLSRDAVDGQVGRPDLLHHFPDGSGIRAVTNEEGKATIAIPRLDGRETQLEDAYVVVEKGGYCAYRRESTLYLMSRHSILEVTLVRGAGISGRLLNQGGEPLSGMPFQVAFRGADDTGAWCTLTAGGQDGFRTGILGEFLVADLPAGAFRVRFDVPGFVAATALVPAVEEGSRDVELRLVARADASFRYVDASTGAPLEVMRYALYQPGDEPDRDDPAVETGTRRLKAVSLSDLDPGTWLLRVWFHGTPTRHHEHSFSVEPGDRIDEDIRTDAPPSGVIAGRAVDESGNPIAGLFIALDQTDGRAWRVAKTMTDQDGSFRFEMLGRTTYELGPDHQDYMRIRLPVDLTDDWDESEIEIRLQPAAFLELEFPEVEGGNNIPVKFHYADHSVVGLGWVRGGTVERLRIPWPGKGTLRFHGIYYSVDYFDGDDAAFDFDIQPGETIRLPVHALVLGSVSGTITDAQGSPFRPYSLTLVRVGPGVHDVNEVMDRLAMTTYTRWQGDKWSATGLATGRYLLVMRRGQDQPYELLRDVTLKGVVNAPIDVVLDE